MNNKRGMSDVVTTIVIIGVALVVVGVVWYVINSVIETQTTKVENASGEMYQTCDEAEYDQMISEAATCDGTIKYLGGQKCCAGTCGGVEGTDCIANT